MEYHLTLAYKFRSFGLLPIQCYGIRMVLIIRHSSSALFSISHGDFSAYPVGFVEL